jgi:chemosensory pili system protein ChpA (sensor histidine kinase/response regulator)
MPKVLIADDSPLVLRMIEKMLTSAGYEVATAHDGREALERASSERFALAILDVSMPRMNGDEACRALKAAEATRALPVIILTSREAGEMASLAGAGADHYISKDTNTHHILDLVKSVLG